MRTAAKVDNNQRQLAEELRALGFHCWLTWQLGKGGPDMVVTGHNRQTGRTEALLVEIKRGRTSSLTNDEIVWHRSYPHDGPLIQARSSADVLQWFGAI